MPSRSCWTVRSVSPLRQKRSRCPSMAGPWISFSLDLAYAAHITWNIGTWESPGSFRRSCRKRRAEWQVLCQVDPHPGPTLREWIDGPNGHGNPGIYSPASNSSTNLASTYGDPPILPIGAWCKIGTVHDFDIREVLWLRRHATVGLHLVSSVAVKAWTDHGECATGGISTPALSQAGQSSRSLPGEVVTPTQSTERQGGRAAEQRNTVFWGGLVSQVGICSASLREWLHVVFTLAQSFLKHSIEESWCEALCTPLTARGIFRTLPCSSTLTACCTRS